MDNYIFFEKIAQSSESEVYKGYHKRLQKEIVLKKQVQKGNYNLRNEANILKMLHHSSFPKVIDYLSLEGEEYLVMDYIHGITFQKLIEKGTRFSRRQLYSWNYQTAKAIQYLHSRVPSIIHGDIKPENLILTSLDEICLIDFNIAGILRDRYIHAAGYTKEYAPPEQRENYKMDVRADIYSMSKTFYDIAICKQREEKIGVWERLKREKKAGLRYIWILKKGMRKKSDNRYQTIDEFLEELGKVLNVDEQLDKLKWICVFFLFVLVFRITN